MLPQFWRLTDICALTWLTGLHDDKAPCFACEVAHLLMSWQVGMANSSECFENLLELMGHSVVTALGFDV